MVVRLLRNSKPIIVLAILIVINQVMASGQKSVTFALLADLHVYPGTKSDSSLQFIVNEINNSDVSFTVVAGDLTNEGSDAELLAVKKALDKLRKPFYVLPGNHETNWAESAGLTINRLWGNDRFLFEVQDFLFVGFNTGPYMKMGDGHIKQEDLQWLKRQLEQKMTKDKVLISFAHYPLAEGLDNWLQVTDLLKSFGCKIAFCGHGHQLTLLNFNGIPGIMGRSQMLGKSVIPGYNIVKLENDSVMVFNKELSIPVGKPAVALNYIKHDALAKIPASQMPDFSLNQVYTNRKIIAELSDTASIFSGPCLFNDTIIIHGNSPGDVKAISTKSKKTIWVLHLDGPVYSTPVSSQGIVVLGTVDGNILGLNGLSGRQIWKVETGRPVLAEGLIEKGFVYIGGGDKCFYKIDIKTGKIIWQFSGVAGLIQGKAAVSRSSVVFGAWDRYLYCLDKKSGSLKWKWTNGKPQNLYSPGNIVPVCTSDRVFIVAPDRFMTAIDINTGETIWRTNRHQVRESLGASPDGSLIYAKLMNDTVIAVSSKGDFPKTVWKVNAGFGYEHNPCPILATRELVVAATRAGMLVAIDPKTQNILWKYKAGNSSVNKVVIDSRKTLWFTLMEGKVCGIRTGFK